MRLAPAVARVEVIGSARQGALRDSGSPPARCSGGLLHQRVGGVLQRLAATSEPAPCESQRTFIPPLPSMGSLTLESEPAQMSGSQSRRGGAMAWAERKAEVSGLGFPLSRLDQIPGLRDGVILLES